MSEASDNGGEPHRHVCPECAAPRALDGTPSCSCNRRASEALRDARTAEAAVAEDFDPLRIRPYVELGGEPEGTPPGAPPSAPRQPDDIPTLAMPVASTTTRPDSADVGLFEDDSPEPAKSEPTKPTPSPAPEHTPRRGHRMALAVAGAVATVLAVAGFASGLFSYDTPTRGKALPEDLRASVPDTSADGEASPEPSGTAPSAAPAPDAPPPPSNTGPSESPAEPDSSASPSASPTPTRAAPSPSASTPEAPGSDEPDDQRRPRTLRLGDEGPEVTELQLRLRQVALYFGDIDENFDEQVEASVRQYQFTRRVDEDDSGVYGGVTREKLESETDEP